MIYIIEHLEPDLYDWCMMEYKQISKHVGKENVYFTNLKEDYFKALEPYGKCFTQSVTEMELKDSCLMDLKPEETLRSNNPFKYLIFGGILGDDPPKGRTKVLSNNLKCERRNLGKEQFSTDTAVYVAKEIIAGKKLEDISFIPELVITIEDGEEVILPFNYPLKDKKPVVSSELIERIKKDGFF